jgi:nitrate reductase NapAB chaperone NapD
MGYECKQVIVLEQKVRRLTSFSGVIKCNMQFHTVQTQYSE